MGAQTCTLRGAAEDEQAPSPVSSSWRAYQGNRLVDRARLEELFERTWELDRHEADAWTLRELDAISALTARGEALPAAAAHRLWRGVPDSWKALVWSAAACSGTKAASSDASSALERAVSSTFGQQVPRRFERCPSFDGLGHERRGDGDLVETVPFLDLLAPPGVVAAQKLLWCLSEAWRLRVERCPLLPGLVVLLLIFSPDEASAYATASAILTRAVGYLRDHAAAAEPEGRFAGDFPFLPLTAKGWRKLAAATVGLLKLRSPELHEHLLGLGVALEEVAERCLSRGLMQVLPFRAVCRAFGAFLAEGSEVFASLLVALWRHQCCGLLACGTAAEAERLLVPPSEEMIVQERARQRGTSLDEGAGSPTSFAINGAALGIDDLVDAGNGAALGIDDLVRFALGVELPTGSSGAETLGGATPKSIEMQEYSKDDESRVFCRPRLNGEPSRIVWDELWPYLWQWLPPLFRIRDPVVAFSAHRDGFALSTLMRRCDMAAPDVPMLLAAQVRTIGGVEAVVGVFMPAALRTTGGGYQDLAHYDVLGAFACDAYVFRVVGDAAQHSPPQVWHWSGYNALLVHAPRCNSNALVIGGDSLSICFGGDCVALSFDQALARGSTDASATFNSPPLLPATVGGVNVAEGEEGGRNRENHSSVQYSIIALEVFELD